MFLLLFTTFLVLFIIKLILNFTFWYRHGIPNYPYPMIGWMFMTMDKFFLHYGRKAKIYGGYVFFQKFLAVNDPQVARDLSIKQLHDFSIRLQIHVGQSSIAKSLFFLETDADWKRIRNIVTKSFTSGKLKTMMEPITEIGDDLIESLRKFAKTGEAFDARLYLDTFTMNVIARCAYGIRLDQNSSQAFISMAKRILQETFTSRQACCVFFPGLAKLLKLEFFDQEAVKYFDDLTEAIIAKRRDTGQNYNDLIGLMMKATDAENGSGITPKEISAQSVLFFIAGYDHTLYYLAEHPEWQKKLYDELKDITLEYDKLTSLPILNAIIYEVLRLKPSLVAFDRVANKDCEVLNTGIKVPKGTNISISPFVIHRNAEYFESPDDFLPERFIGTGLENSVQYMPFGTGNRLCVGMRFALNELRIGVAKFFTNYKVTLAPDFALEYNIGSGLLSPKTVKISISER